MADETLSNIVIDRKFIWWLLGIVATFIPIIVIGLVKIYTWQQDDRYERLTQTFERYIIEHNKRHFDEWESQRQKDKDQEEHFRTTDATVRHINDIIIHNSETIQRARELERTMFALQLRIQRLEDQEQRRPSGPRADPDP